MSEHNFKTKRSTAYLDRLTPAEQEEAKRQLTWDWTDKAKDLLTRYPRRSGLYHEPFLTPEALEQEFVQQWGERFPAILEFQKELAGVTFPTYGDDGDWLTLGIQDVAPPSDFEAGELIQFSCADFNTARPDTYLITPAGEVVHFVHLAQSWKIEVERLAYYLNFASSSGPENAWMMAIRDMPLLLPEAFALMELEARKLGWSLYLPGADLYHRIFEGSSGFMSCEHESQSEEASFFRISAKHPEAIRIMYDSLSSQLELPPLKFDIRANRHIFTVNSAIKRR